MMNQIGPRLPTVGWEFDQQRALTGELKRSLHNSLIAALLLGVAGMAWTSQRQDALLRTGKSMGERPLRELQLQAQRWPARTGNLLHDKGSQTLIEW